MKIQTAFLTVGRDLRSALRTARKDPLVSAIIVLSLAVGVSMNTLVYSAVDSLLLRPLPYPDADRLVVVWAGNTREPGHRGGVAPADFLDWRARAHAFVGLAAAGGTLVNLSGPPNPERIQAARVSASFFPDVLQVQPLLGRFFTAAEDEEAASVAILSHGLWQRQFGGEQSVVGQVVRLGGRPYTIIGVLPPSVLYPAVTDPPSRPQMWLPLSLSPAERTQRGARYLTVFARLRPGVSFEAAQSEMTAIATALEQAHPLSNAARGAFLARLATQITGNVRTPLRLLAGAVALVLLITCTNIAALLLTRAIGRRREVALRFGIGATRARVVGQFLIENIVLALVGGASGVALAAIGRPVVIALAGASVPQLEYLAMDGRVLAFALAITMVTGIAFGLAPALQASMVDVNELLKQSGRSTTISRGGRIALNGMVTAQFAISVVLLLGASLLMRSFLALQRVDLGFRPTGILSFETSLPPARYSPPEHAATFDAILDRIRSLPAVRAAGAVNVLPLGGGDFSWTFHAESRHAPQSSPLPVADYRIVTPGYFEVLSIGLQRGRAFTEQDVAKGRPVAIISESMARRYWPNEDPIDKRIRLDGPITRYPWLTIVGVVRDVHYTAIDTVPPPTFYRPLRQHAWPNMSIVIRADGDARSTVAAVRAQVAEIDRELPLANIRDMPTVVADSIALRRFTLFLIASFASVALILALAGIYGVLSYILSTRVQEFGIRMALGAAPVQVLSQTFWAGMRLVVGGTIIGVLGSAAFGKIIAGLLYGVKSTDPLTYAAVTVTSTLVAALACLVSSWRALSIDPITALRAE